MRIASCLLLLALLCGCSIHPVQQEVTGVRTPDLVRHIKCEARKAVEDKAIWKLRHEPGVSLKTLQFADMLDQDRDLFRTFNPRKELTPAELRFYYRYIIAAIAFDFTFNITEDNSVNVAADPIRLLTYGTVGMNVGAGVELKRNNLRRFQLSSTFDTLLHDSTLRCEDFYPHSNYTYPIEGSIGLGELIDTFVDLNEFSKLNQLGKDDGAKVFADTLIFTTMVMGSASPHLVLTPARTHRVGLASSVLSGGASRTDLHQVIIGLSFQPAADAARTRAAATVVPYTPRSALSKRDVKSPVERSAIDAISQQRLDTYLDSLGNAFAR